MIKVLIWITGYKLYTVWSEEGTVSLVFKSLFGIYYCYFLAVRKCRQNVVNKFQLFLESELEDVSSSASLFSIRSAVDSVSIPVPFESLPIPNTRLVRLNNRLLTS